MCSEAQPKYCDISPAGNPFLIDSSSKCGCPENSIADINTDSCKCGNIVTSCGTDYNFCQDCSILDGWYDSGNPYVCCDGTSNVATCQNKEYRKHDGLNQQCTYKVTQTKTEKTDSKECGTGISCVAGKGGDSVYKERVCKTSWSQVSQQCVYDCDDECDYLKQSLGGLYPDIDVKIYKCATCKRIKEKCCCDVRESITTKCSKDNCQSDYSEVSNTACCPQTDAACGTATSCQPCGTGYSCKNGVCECDPTKCTGGGKKCTNGKCCSDECPAAGAVHFYQWHKTHSCRILFFKFQASLNSWTSKSS